MDNHILKFVTQNHKSLRDEQTLSFTATDKDDPRVIRPKGIDEALLPVTAIYGANASGKSNVLDALSFAVRAVILSQRVWQPDDGIERQPFSLGTDSSAPSVYIVSIALDGTRYEYGFAVNDEVVVEEWLYAWPLGRKQELFTRDHQSFTFGRNLPGENRAIEALTRPNSLFLSAAAQNNHEYLSPIFSWFSSGVYNASLTGPWSSVGGIGGGVWWSQFAPREQLDLVDEASHRREQVRALLASADLGIQDFRVEEERVPISTRTGGGARVIRRISFSHRAAEQSAGSWLPLEQESTGTQALVRILPYLVRVLERGGLLTLDELNSLHPMLALAIIRLFQDPRRNPHGAQLLFNTHEASLLGNLLCDPPPLRRDQVWLTEKDQEGATHLYPLTDYKPRPAENLERGYLQGRYGAVPFIGALEWMSVPEEPQT